MAHQQNQNRWRYAAFAESTAWKVISQVVFWTSTVLAITLLILTPISSIHTDFFLWNLFLANPAPIAALVMGVMGTYLARAVPLSFNPTEREQHEMGQRGLGGVLGAVVYASIALTPITLIFLGLDLYGGFWLASLAVVWFYPFKQASQQRKNFVLSWWQNWPGVILFILKGLSLFGKLTPAEKQAAQTDLRIKAQQRDRWYKRMPNAFYYVAPYALIVLSGWVIYYSGALFHSSYGYPALSGPQATYLTAVSVATGLGFGWIAFSVTTLVLWWTRVGFPFKRGNFLGFQRTLFITLVSIIPGPFSQVMGFAMVALFKGDMVNAQQIALFVVYSQFGGNIILLLPYAAQAFGMKKGS